MLELPSLLGDWLPRQRWFAGKGRAVTAYVIEDVTQLSAGDPALCAVVVRVDYADGPPERYSLLIGLRRDLPQRLEYAAIGRAEGWWTYDAVHDHDLMEVLLQKLADADDYASAGVRPAASGIRFERMPGETIKTGLPSRVSTAEQSNTSVIYGDTYILKLFRKLAPGINPDLEITRALALAGSHHIARPYAWFEGQLDGEPVTLGLLQEFLVSATEGWALATTSVRDLYAEEDLHADEVGGDFAGEAERLGAVTAEVHDLLARTLPTETAGPAQLQAIAARMHERLDAAIALAPGLSAYVRPLRAAYDELAAYPAPVHFQRIHGDYHLGQVLRTDTGWVLLDFEGEPAKPLAERVATDSPLRDIAGMLRSFDYAARFLLAERPGNSALEYRATEWAGRNRAAFCKGYAGAAGRDPREDRVLVRGYELDKAVYEVLYEARHRPNWLSIPLQSIERLVAQ